MSSVRCLECGSTDIDADELFCDNCEDNIRESKRREKEDPYNYDDDLYEDDEWVEDVLDEDE